MIIQNERPLLKSDYASSFSKEVIQLGALKFLLILRLLCKTRPDEVHLISAEIESFIDFFPHLDTYQA